VDYFENIGFDEVDYGAGYEGADAALAWMNDIVEWLKMNKPDSEVEIDALKKMVVEFAMDDDFSVGWYGIRETYGHRLVFGPKNMLFLTDDTMVKYFLELLEGLRFEMAAESVSVAA